MKKIWVIINNMNRSIFFIPFLFLLLISCSDIKSAPMNKVNEDSRAIFNLPNLKDEYINAENYKGSYILINFWATWCAPCVKEIPSLNNLYNKFKDKKNFKMIAINIGQSKAAVKKFLFDKSLPIEFAVLLDEKMELSDWNIQAIPTTFLVDEKGKIIYKVEGEKEWDSDEFSSFFSSIIE
tara:strand:+ start:614 stop:1156 length:543 start_codon:yes stop_codon:yes gene_type:complete